MSKDIIVLTPNGRRQKIHCTPDTSILQVLEDVCQKQGFQSNDYALKHHNHILDLTTTIRFSNLPNKATLEMVETETQRHESNVTIGLLLEDGERRTADFSPNVSLYDLINELAPTEFSSFSHPAILYMRQEVAGVSALRAKTLRQLGLLGGRAILRLLNKSEEVKQANVSSIFRKPLPEKDNTRDSAKEHNVNCENTNKMTLPGPSQDHESGNPKYCNLVDSIKEITKKNDETGQKHVEIHENKKIHEPEIVIMEVDTIPAIASTSSSSLASQEKLERRLKIEEEVTFLGTQKAIAFIPEGTDDELDDLPDDFYDLTVEEVRKLYNDLQQHRLDLENTPLVTSSRRELQNQISQQKIKEYKNVVVRIQFPDHIILQGVFSPTDKIQNVINFIKLHLQNPNKPFHIFTTPLKETLDPEMTLMDAKFVPCVHIHFKWLHEDVKSNSSYLKEEIYLKKTPSNAASILASKYRAPSRSKVDLGPTTPDSAKASTSKNSKVPKWFKK